MNGRLGGVCSSELYHFTVVGKMDACGQGLLLDGMATDVVAHVDKPRLFHA
jgi:hypothetical protein